MTFQELFDDYEKKMDRDLLNGSEKIKLQKTLGDIRARYADLDPSCAESAIGKGLIERGQKFLKAGPLKGDVVRAFYRHAKAAWYDLSGNLGAYTWYVRCFFAATIAFFVIAPQFFPPILPLLFIIPVFIGLRGLKGRSFNGFTMSAMLFPMSMLAGITGIRAYGAAILGGLSMYAAEWGGKINLSVQIASILIPLFFVVSAAGIAASLGGAIIGFRNREMFV